MAQREGMAGGAVVRGRGRAVGRDRAGGRRKVGGVCGRKRRGWKGRAGGRGRGRAGDEDRGKEGGVRGRERQLRRGRRRRQQLHARQRSTPLPCCCQAPPLPPPPKGVWERRQVYLYVRSRLQGWGRRGREGGGGGVGKLFLPPWLQVWEMQGMGRAMGSLCWTIRRVYCACPRSDTLTCLPGHSL